MSHAEICPVCHGKGSVQEGFYRQNLEGQWTSNTTGDEVCRSCNGKGYIEVGGEEMMHYSDCAVHNEPAYPAGECNCGGIPLSGGEMISRPEPPDWTNQESDIQYIRVARASFRTGFEEGVTAAYAHLAKLLREGKGPQLPFTQDEVTAQIVHFGNDSKSERNWAQSQRDCRVADWLEGKE